jgi:Flp pilus assembly protein TadD
MSVILDALKKAQDERRRANSRPTDGDELLPPKKMRRLYYLFGMTLVLLGIVLFIPDLQQILKFGAGTRGTTPLGGRPSTTTAPPVAPGPSKPEARKINELTKLETPPDKAGVSGQASKEKAAPKVSWAPSIQVPASGRQDRMSVGMLSAPEQKPPSAMDQEQSIVVKRANVKDSAAEMYNNALKAMELGRADEARRSYLAVLADRPDDAETLNNLGVLVMNGGNTRDAFPYFKMALNCRADYPKAHNNLGILYMREGQKRPAEEHLRQALKLDPDGVEPYLNLSALLRSEGRFQEASQLLIGLLKKGGKQPIVHLSYAIINDEMGNYPEAITYYREYLSHAAQGAERGTVTDRLKVLEAHQSSGNR